MAQVDSQLSTGIQGLDRMLKGLIPGDNIVWQIDSIEDYKPFLEPYCRSAVELGRKVIYFRFAPHEPLVHEEWGPRIVELDPTAGFEFFISKVHKTISETRREGFFVFDSLSCLAEAWHSDQMLGNFFMLTCPFLYDVEAIAYFALMRGHHSRFATTPISETAQVVIDVYGNNGKLYLHPQKVQQRHSSTMYMLHVWEKDEFVPVTQSAVISEILTAKPWLGLESATYRLGVWNRTFHEAEGLWDTESGARDLAGAEEYKRLLLRMAVSRDERVLSLAENYFNLGDLLEIRKRMIGTGLIGGKSVGMLLARAILRQKSPRWAGLLEPHDSFFIGSDVFYTFVVKNGCWWEREKQKNPATFLDGADTARQRMSTGSFPGHVINQFEDMLDYFGQAPIIVRSSSLLEDNFGNAFSGKYDSVFCANQGSREKRLHDFLTAVRTIYASTMSERALRYRARRGILDRDEQMALLVQRVSGAMFGSLFYPQAAGVALSYNPFRWSEYIDPEAGMARIVFGLGTRAVDRHDDDYTRVVALNAPERRPEADFDQVRRFSQRKVDYLDLDANQLLTGDFETVVRESPGIETDMFVSLDQELDRMAPNRGALAPFPWVLTFEKLLNDTDFVPNLKEMLDTLQEAYEFPVDTEFTVNFAARESYRINLLQCRPLQIKGGGTIIEPPPDLDRNHVIFESHGAVIGQSRLIGVDWLVFVSPRVYGLLPMGERYSIARLIGKITHHQDLKSSKTIMLAGPGRWGTTMPSLGVPVSFAEINTVSVLCEIVAMNELLIPDVSLGTHFFNDLVEMDILYMALFPERDNSFLNNEFFENIPNSLVELVPNAARWSEAVKVIDASNLPDGKRLMLNADILKQQVLCYLIRNQE